MSIHQYSEEEIGYLALSEDYRDFMKRVIEVRSANGKKFGYADLARISEFASRSYPRDVILGDKIPTLESVNKLIKGMSLQLELKEFFRLLIEVEVKSLRSPDKSEKEIKNILDNLRGRLLKKEDSLLKRKEYPYSNPLIPTVFAALGPQDRGASLEEVKSRTGQSGEAIKSCLKDMIDLGMTTFKEDRFYPNLGHVSLQYLSNKTYYKNYVRGSLNHILENLDQDFQKSGHLFFTSSFSIREADMPKLKEELRSLLLQFVDKTEVPEGDKVAHITCSFKL